MDMLEEKSRWERDPDPEVEEDIRLSDDRKNQWKGIVEDNINEKGESHALR